MEDERSTPATKGDLIDVRDSLVEAIYDSKTEILKAFYGFSETLQNLQPPGNRQIPSP